MSKKYTSFEDALNKNTDPNIGVTTSVERLQYTKYV